MQPRANPIHTTILIAKEHIESMRYDLLQAMLERGEVDPFVVIYPRARMSLIDLLLFRQDVGVELHADEWKACIQFCLTHWKEDLQAEVVTKQERQKPYQVKWVDWVIVYACAGGDPELVKILLDWGCDPNVYISGEMEESPLSAALKPMRPWADAKACLEFLRAAGVSWKVHGTNILFFAMGMYHKQSFRWLITHGAADDFSEDSVYALEQQLAQKYRADLISDLLLIVQFYLRRRAMPFRGIGSELMQGWTRMYRPAGET